jgi:hypothetical protein
MQAHTPYRPTTQAREIALPAPARVAPMSQIFGILALLLVVLSSPFLYDLAIALGFAR